jgi:hypothetical protein
MISPALYTLLIAVSAFLSALVGHLKPLTSDNLRDRKWGLISIILLIPTIGLQIYYYIYNEEEAKNLNNFLAHQETKIDEASGATSLNSRFFIVDDDGQNLYEYREAPKDRVRGLSFHAFYRIHTTSRTQLKNIKPEEVNYVNDLEAAATNNNKLYLVTSQSQSSTDRVRRSGRELLLEVEPPSSKKQEYANVLRAVRLRRQNDDKIQKALKQIEDKLNGSLEQSVNDPNLEGLAIDKKGNFYLGFRNPILMIGSESYAIILKTTRENIFANSLQFEGIALKLNSSDPDENYGIVSLEYDNKTDTLLVLGNAPQKNKFLPPKLWHWHPNDELIQEATQVQDWSLKIPEYFRKNESPAKPEAIVVPMGSKYGFVFTDSERHGGIWQFPRQDLGFSD